MIDIHCHILPSIDDGSKSLEESIEMARIAERDGIRKIVATPHQLEGLYQPTSETILLKIALINKTLQDLGSRIEILPGSDVHIAADLVPKIESGEILCINRKNYILLEFPNQFVPDRILKLLENLFLKNIIPIITHPERNFLFQRHPNLLCDMIKAGALTQITAMSITGEFGKEAKKCAKKMLTHGMTHFIASDSHSSNHRPPVISTCIKHLKKIISDEEIEELVSGNPEMAITGRRIYPREPEKIRTFFGFF
ncbi:MAG: tyrosine protein phosphatase [Candidatus Schekmanbacteria bacterium]|nr:MAG: tyrosine protein phosphatase [Candidatus Schekmanbacteria bacterium]